MGTHPIFESDFDCLTESMKWTTACLVGYCCVISAQKSHIAVNNSLYLGQIYPKRTLSPGAINAHFAALEVEDKPDHETGPYYAGDVLKRYNGLGTESVELESDYFGSCEVKPVGAMTTSSIRCSKTVLNCPKLAALTIENLCQDTICVDQINLQLYVDYLSNPQLVADAADVALNANCITYMRYSFVFTATGAGDGHTLASASLYTDFGPSPSSSPQTVRVSIGSTVETTESVNLASQVPYRANQVLYLDNAPDLSHFTLCDHFQLKMGQSQQMECSLIFASTDDCTTRYNAVNQVYGLKISSKDTARQSTIPNYTPLISINSRRHIRAETNSSSLLARHHQRHSTRTTRAICHHSCRSHSSTRKIMACFDSRAFVSRKNSLFFT